MFTPPSPMLEASSRQLLYLGISTWRDTQNRMSHHHILQKTLDHRKLFQQKASQQVLRESIQRMNFIILMCDGVQVNFVVVVAECCLWAL